MALIGRYFPPASKAYRLLVGHGQAVAQMALAVADNVGHLKPDVALLERGALLHDIGIGRTDSPRIGCYGRHPYVLHGVFGRQIMEEHGYPRIAMICERHLGAGVSAEDIKSQGLPLPVRDMLPLTLEEQIICYADKFFSKTSRPLHQAKPLEAVLAGLKRFGPEQVARFEKLHRQFGI